ncbi:piggyBac transposable element-derived protein 5 [Mobula hypostoma]|uniref:piggyBac transposable element-derived protein 5 n=1 Tax=Mobula hypostoma TaxID=723540 RepID=UPI002FC38F46
MATEEVAAARRKALSLLRAARSRYESLQISDDVFGESGGGSSSDDNPFYSTSAGSSQSDWEEEEEEEPGAASGSVRPADTDREPGEEEEEEEEEAAAAGWTERLKDIAFPPFTDSTGPVHKMPLNASAIDFFQLFVPDNVIRNMVVQTNMYAKKYQEKFGFDEGWSAVSLPEMKTFLGYMISTSIHHCESVLSIWSSGFYSNKSIALMMTQARFEKILKYFHIVAFRSSQTAHGLYKIQPFLDCLQMTFDAAFKPSQTQVLHEPLIDEDPLFIATCTDRELRKRKKRKFSLWVRQCASTGYICQIYIHLKEGTTADELDTLKNKPQLHSLVAKSLCQNLMGKNYIIYTGPSITSLNLFEEFEKKGIYCCGLLSTKKSDCTGLPQSMLVNPEPPRVRGHYRVRMKRNMSLISWANKGQFYFLTNAYSPFKEGVIIRRKSGEIRCPLAVEAFAAHLGYICKYDDKYSKYFISHKPNKTWQQVFWFVLSIAVNNAYILYKMSEAYLVRRYTRLQFGERLVKELFGIEEHLPSK